MNLDDFELRAALDYDEARSFFELAKHDIADKAKETPLRNLFCTRLPSMFPSKPWWIDEHARHAETNATFSVRNVLKKGFTDTLIGYTAVEYEKNLSWQSLFAHGYEQVEDYCADLLNKNVESDNIVGVLSDTVHWFAYRVVVEYEAPTASNGKWGRDDLRLDEIDSLDMTDTSDDNLKNFERFINRYYGRIGSKELTPKALVADFGLMSGDTSLRIEAIKTIVIKGCDRNPEYSRLIKGLWMNFIEGVSGKGNSFIEDYSHELYIITLAKLIAANVLDGHAHFRSNQELREILKGSYFTKIGIENLVEYDYFGWLSDEPYIDDIIDISVGIQRDLMAYDFSTVRATDLFGELISQMAGLERRILLGQAPTPKKLARMMVNKVLNDLGDIKPRLVDMCCGSGIFIVETLLQLIDITGNPQSIDSDGLALLNEAIYGFDVDPLAVLLAKVNWILVMREYIPLYSPPVHIPIYHADSLFMQTPISKHTTLGRLEIKAQLHDRSIVLPSFLLSHQFRSLFDELLRQADILSHDYDGETTNLDEYYARNTVTTICGQQGILLSSSEIDMVVQFFIDAVGTLGNLRARKCNGIWRFVLSNTFKPAFTEGMFNGVISNPPWLALSRLRGNPYHDLLVNLANEYGVMPRGSSFLHVELATIFFISSIQRYLVKDGCIACAMPHSLLNGKNGDPFRTRKYLDAPTSTDLCLTDIWELPKTVFKNRAVVIFGQKKKPTGRDESIKGLILDDALCPEEVMFKLVTNGKTTAFSSRSNQFIDAFDSVEFNQGFDGMPRSAMFFDAQAQQNGLWTLSSIPKNGHSLSFVVRKAKSCKDFNISNVCNIHSDLIYNCITSNLLMPFAPIVPLKIFLAVKWSPSHGVDELTDTELALYGSSDTLLANRVKHCQNNGIEFYAGRGGYLPYIDWWGKLDKTLSDTSPWRVLYGASGANIAATYIKVDEISEPHKLAIEQSVYWRGVQSEDEALYYVGMLNSDVLNDAIKDLQPEGNRGKRHIHRLPTYRMYEYDPDNITHQEVISAAEDLQCVLQSAWLNDQRIANYLDPNRGELHVRRRQLQNYYKQLPEFLRLNRAAMDAM